MSTRGKLPLALSALLATTFLTAAASARTYNITSNKDDNNGCTLRLAIQAANTNQAAGACAAGQGVTDVINLKSSGAYRITGAPLVITEPVHIKSDVSGTRRTIVGGPHDPTLTLRNSLDVRLTDLILSHEVRDGNTIGLLIDGTDAQAFLRKVVVKNNNRGIVLVNASKLDTLTVAIHDNNNSSNDGGGIFNCGNCIIHIEKTSIYKNSGHFGGGIYNNSNAEIRDSTIAQNTAEQGGGIYLDSGASQADIKLSTITKNSASIGSGIARIGGAIPLYKSILSGNSGTDCFNVVSGGMGNEVTSTSIFDPSCDFDVQDGEAAFVQADPELASTATTHAPEMIGFKPASEDALPRNRGGDLQDEDDRRDQHGVTRKFTAGDFDDGVDIGALELK